MPIGDARVAQSSLSLPGPQSNGFHTSGSLDWVGLTTKTVSFSIEALSRCTAAGVDPYTVLIGQAICQKLPLGTFGRRNVEEALSSLMSYGGLGAALWFGFGIKSFARVLGMTDQGRSLMAICAALSECFHVDYSAQVLHNIVLLNQPPGDLTPSAHEWLMVVRECSGVFSRSKFPVLAEGFMRLVDSTRRLTSMMYDESEPLMHSRGCPKPEDLAESILGIGKVATREYDSIALIGCAAVGWVAAIAEWLYDLTVTIRDTEGNILYSSSIVPQEGQIQIMFRSTARTEGSYEEKAVQVVSKTYQLRDFSEVLGTRSRDDVTFPIVSGRLAWQSCLSHAFGADFARLLSIRMSVGIAIGCAARIFKALANAEAGLDPKALLHCRSYFDASSGQGFILNVVRWFPELEILQTTMDEGVRMSFLDARTQYEAKLAAIQSHCSGACCSEWKFKDDAVRFEEKFCLVVMFETILVLCRILSGTHVAENLLPMRAGFEALYRKQLCVRQDPTLYDHKTQEEVIGPIAYVIDTKDDKMRKETRADNIADRRVADTLRLFTGRQIHLQSWVTVAQSVNGICAYLDILREFSLDSECVGLVNVIPGRIERDHKPFQVIEDLNDLEDHEQPLLPFLSKSRFDSVSMLLSETTNALRISFKMGDKSLQAGKTIQIGPAKLIRTVSEARGLVPCAHWNGSLDIQPEVAFDKADYPVLNFVWRGTTVNGIDCHESDDHYLAVALMQASASHNCLLCQHECLRCCLNYACQRQMEGEPTMILLRQSSFLP